MRKKYKVLDENYRLWEMWVENRKNNIDSNIYAKTRSGLDDISFNGIVRNIKKVTVRDFLDKNKFDYKGLKEELEEKEIIEEVI